MNIYLVSTLDGKVFGVGQTTRSFAERHKDGDWAKLHNYFKARGEELVLVGWWEDTSVLDTEIHKFLLTCLLYTSPSPRDMRRSRMPSSA